MPESTLLGVSRTLSVTRGAMYMLRGCSRFGGPLHPLHVVRLSLIERDIAMEDKSTLMDLCQFKHRLAASKLRKPGESCFGGLVYWSCRPVIGGPAVVEDV